MVHKRHNRIYQARKARELEQSLRQSLEEEQGINERFARRALLTKPSGDLSSSSSSRPLEYDETNGVC